MELKELWHVQPQARLPERISVRSGALQSRDRRSAFTVAGGNGNPTLSLLFPMVDAGAQKQREREKRGKW